MTDDGERAQKEALRTGGTLRRIKRFAWALLEGVPQHERDHPANVATAADHDGSAQGRLLRWGHHGHRDRVSASEPAGAA